MNHENIRRSMFLLVIYFYVLTFFIYELHVKYDGIFIGDEENQVYIEGSKLKNEVCLDLLNWSVFYGFVILLLRNLELDKMHYKCETYVVMRLENLWEPSF